MAPCNWRNPQPMRSLVPCCLEVHSKQAPPANKPSSAEVRRANCIMRHAALPMMLLIEASMALQLSCARPAACRSAICMKMADSCTSSGRRTFLVGTSAATLNGLFSSAAEAKFVKPERLSKDAPAPAAAPAPPAPAPPEPAPPPAPAPAEPTEGEKAEVAAKAESEAKAASETKAKADAEAKAAEAEKAKPKVPVKSAATQKAEADYKAKKDAQAAKAAANTSANAEKMSAASAANKEKIAAKKAAEKEAKAAAEAAQRATAAKVAHFDHRMRPPRLFFLCPPSALMLSDTHTPCG